VLHRGLAILHFRKYLQATKEELWKLKKIHHAKILSSKNPLKETKILQDIL
jgi:hypothetical protein